MFDYKHGQGKIVSAKKNPQMMLYALGILSSFEFADIQKVHLCIVQPRADNISKWSTTRGELLQWVPDAVLAAAKGKMKFEMTKRLSMRITPRMLNGASGARLKTSVLLVLNPSVLPFLSCRASGAGYQ